MFIVYNADNVECFKSESFKKAQETALKMKEDLAENFTIVELKQVWTTQTLDEAIDGSMYELVREQPPL